MILNLPNSITFFRIALIPVFVFVFYLPFGWANIAAAAIFTLASITDWIDGYLARMLKQESSFGAFLDPVADKLMVVVAIVLLVETHPSIYIALPSIVIVAREILISALREWMAELGSRETLQVSLIGKSKTSAQLVSLTMMIYADPIYGLPTFMLGLVVYYLAAFFTLASMVNYLRAAWPVIRKHAG